MGDNAGDEAEEEGRGAEKEKEEDEELRRNEEEEEKEVRTYRSQHATTKTTPTTSVRPCTTTSGASSYDHTCSPGLTHNTENTAQHEHEHTPRVGPCGLLSLELACLGLIWLPSG